MVMEFVLFAFPIHLSYEELATMQGICRSLSLLSARKRLWVGSVGLVPGWPILPSFGCSVLV